MCVNTRLIYFNLNARYLATMTKFNSQHWMHSFFIPFFLFTLFLIADFPFARFQLDTIIYHDRGRVTDKSESERARLFASIYANMGAPPFSSIMRLYFFQCRKLHVMHGNRELLRSVTYAATVAFSYILNV